MTLYSQITYIYDGGDRVFSIPFDFIDKDYLTISINGELLEKECYEIDNFTVIINCLLFPDDIVIITRHTDILKQIVNFTGRNDLNSESLNLANIQLLHSIQETMDLINHALIMDYLGQWDCKNLILRNVAPGVLDTDGVNLLQVKTIAQNYVNNHAKLRNNPHNVTKAQLNLERVNNTNDLEKPISSATQNALNNKVDKIQGKGLSSNDFTNAEKSKLASIEHNAQVNFTKLSELINDCLFISSKDLKTTDNLKEGVYNKYDKEITLVQGTNIIIEGKYPNFKISSTGSNVNVNWGGILGNIENQKDLLTLIQDNSSGLEWNELNWNYPDSNIYWSE